MDQPPTQAIAASAGSMKLGSAGIWIAASSIHDAIIDPRLEFVAVAHSQQAGFALGQPVDKQLAGCAFAHSDLNMPQKMGDDPLPRTFGTLAIKWS